MKTLLSIAATAALITAAPALAQTTADTTAAAQTDAQICIATDTQAAWADGKTTPLLTTPNATVADQQAYCAGLRSAEGTNAGATAPTDTTGATGGNSGTTGTQTPDSTDTDAAAGMTTSMDKPAYPGQ